MPIEIIPGDQAWSREHQNNRQKRWPVNERLYPVASPKSHPTFSIGREDEIFCIGSCFAMEISHTLSRQKYKVLPQFKNLPISPDRGMGDLGFLNKYNVACIYQELRWALDPDFPYSHEQVFVQGKDNLLFDYQLLGIDYGDEPDAAKNFRDAYNLAFKQVRNADVVIITLGLSEAWFDRETGLYLNRSVPNDIARRYPGRFEFHVLDYNQILFYLEAIHKLLVTHLKPGFRLLITVSPVPLRYTFRAQDVLNANTYSKSVQRAAVEAFVQGKTHINYFPSYEFAMLSNPEAVWDRTDYLHVDNSMVEYIMASVMRDYSGAPEADDIVVLAKAKTLMFGNFYEQATTLLKSLVLRPGPARAEAALLLAAVHLPKQHQTGVLSLINHYKIRHFYSLGNLVRKLFPINHRKADRLHLGQLESWNGHDVRGWVFHKKHSKPLTVNLLIGDQKVASVVADIPRNDVAEVHGETRRYCGFQLTLPSEAQGQTNLRALYADTGKDIPGSPIECNPE